MPFNVGVGTSIDYKSAKPSNWKAGDYTQWTPNAIETQNNGTDSSKLMENIFVTFFIRFLTVLYHFRHSNSCVPQPIQHADWHVLGFKRLSRVSESNQRPFDWCALE